jgi:ribosomal protein S18 acetylase RimI-like enzyme
MTYLLRRATLNDLPDVLNLLGARAMWLRESGLDQWQLRDPARDTERSIKRGDTWVLAVDFRSVATITMTTIADADFWTAAERDEPAIYVSKLATALDASGRGLGTTLIDGANHYAAQRCIPRLRWDVWRSNRDLQAYYTKVGGTHLRTVEVEGRSSGALFEMAYQDRQLAGTRVLDPIGTVATAPSTIRRPYKLGVPHAEAGDHGPTPSHWHVLDNLRLVDARCSDWPELLISGDLVPDQVQLIDSGDGWRAHSLGVHACPIEGELVASLKPGRVYELRHVGNHPYCAVALRGDVDTSMGE